MLENQPTTFIDLLNACICQKETTKNILNDLNTLLRLKALHMRQNKLSNNLDEILESNKKLADFYQKVLEVGNNQEKKNG